MPIVKYVLKETLKYRVEELFLHELTQILMKQILWCQTLFTAFYCTVKLN